MALLISFNPFFLASHNFGLYFGYIVLIVGVLLNLKKYKIPKQIFLIWYLMTSWIVLQTVASNHFSLFSQLNFIFVISLLPLLILAIPQLSSSTTEQGFVWVFLLVNSLLFFATWDLEKENFNGLYASGSMLGGQASIIALIYILRFIDSGEKMALVASVGALAILALSEHRGGVLAFCVCLLVLLGSMRQRRLFVVGLTSTVLFISLLPTIIPLIFFSDAMTLENINSSGRFNVWPSLFREWLSGPTTFFFGSGGAGSSQTFLIKEFDGANIGIIHPHNEFLRFGYEFGFIGLLLWLGFYYRILKTYTIYPNILFIHVLIEAFVSNVLYWQIMYLIPILLLSRRNGKKV